MEPTKRRRLSCEGSYITVVQREQQETCQTFNAKPNNVTWQSVNSGNGDEEMQVFINKFGDIRLIPPPSPFELLPTEILHKIFSHIIGVDKYGSTDLSCPESREAFYRLCLVSRRVSLVAYPFMYKNVAIKNQHSLTRLVRQVIQNPDLRPLIRNLVVRNVLCETPGNTDRYYHLKQVLSTTYSFSRPPENSREARLRRFVQEIIDKRPCRDYHHAVIFLLLHYLPELECIRLQTWPPTWPTQMHWLGWFWSRFWQQMTCETVGPDRYARLPSAMIAARQGVMAQAQNWPRATERQAVGDDNESSVSDNPVLMPSIRRIIFDWNWPAHSDWRQDDTTIFDLRPPLSSQPAEPLGNRVTSIDILMEHPNTFSRLSEVLVNNEVMKHLRLRTDGIACFQTQPRFWVVKIPVDDTKPNELLKKWTRSLRTLHLDLLLDQRASIYMFGSPRDAHLTSVHLLDNITDLTISLEQSFRAPQAMDDLLRSAEDGMSSNDLVIRVLGRFPKSLVNLTLTDWWSCRIRPDRRWGRFPSREQDRKLMGRLLGCLARRLDKTTHPSLRTVTAVAVWPYAVKAWGNEMHWAYGASPEEWACALLSAHVKFTLLMRKVNVGRDHGLRDDGRDREDDDLRDVDMG